MNLKVVVYVLSLIGGIVSASMALPVLWALAMKTPDLPVLLECMVFSLAICAFFALAARPPRQQRIRDGLGIRAREAFAIVTFSWIVASVIGAMPYLCWGTVTSFTDGFFEAMSGFTTTGSSILTDIESNPQGILLWRATTHWLGGMGIIVLGLAVLSFVGGANGAGSMELFKAESPTPVPEKLTPRLKDTAVLLWKIYMGLTALEVMALMLCGATFYEAVTHSFATLATGGFSIYNDSIAHFGSPLIEWVITGFTLLAGVNFSLHYLFIIRAARGQWRGSIGAFLDDEEFRCYALLALAATAAVTLSGFFSETLKLSFSTALRHGAFQVITILTTTGFGITDTLQWPYLTHCIMLLLMFVGGCAGSTGGGLKVMRVILLCKGMKNDLTRSLQPRRVLCLRFNGKPQSPDLIAQIFAFFFSYMLILAGLTLLLAGLGLDLVSAFSGVLACLSNIGPGLGQFGPVSNYAAAPTAGKWALSFAMLAGRLEITTVLILFLPSVWRR